MNMSSEIHKKAKHQKMGHGGSVDDCPHCMADGGEVEDLHHSPAGGSANRAKGAARHRAETSQEGIHRTTSIYRPGESMMGEAVRQGDTERAKRIAYDKIKEQRNSGSIAKTGLYAEGGEVEGPDMPDEEMAALQDSCVDELMDSFERKDKGQILEALRALVLSVR